jgi:hypothetical protein
MTGTLAGSFSFPYGNVEIQYGLKLTLSHFGEHASRR